MINKDEIQIVLDRLYEYISFEAGEVPHFHKLKELFIEEALVMEYSNEGSLKHRRKDINQHIEEMNKVFADYPEIMKEGFNEEEMENSMNIYGPMAFVRSKYKKKYFNGKNEVVTRGANCIHMGIVDGSLKILSIGWYEN